MPAFDAPSESGRRTYRAEDLSRDELAELTVLSDREQETVRALQSPGQRLLIGPRGSGKSTYLKVAYFEALDEGRALPIYVNYARSIALEPEFRKSASALPLFRQWVLGQIVEGIGTSLADAGAEPSSELRDQIDVAKAVVSAIERRRIDQVPESTFDLATVLSLLQNAAVAAGRKRAVLLLDDAAHAFAPEQQREFFEIFAGLRSRFVSSKAAVYPGITSYTPRFHVGHDAQLIDVWLRPEESNYARLMREIAEKRLSAEQFAQLEKREGLLEYLALASFGIPRTLITMLVQLTEDDPQLRSTSNITDPVIAEAANNALKMFTSLEAKLPRYKNFVSVGIDLVDGAIEAIKAFNDSRAGGPQTGRATRIWVEEPIPQEVDRIVGFLEYAGVVRQQVGSVSQGGRSFKVLVPHYGLLVSRTALGLGRNPSTVGAVAALNSRQHTVRVRRKLPPLLGDGFIERCRLDLGACSNCGTQRENPEARFCANCGSPLSQVSVYEELLDTSIESLPISDAILTRILNGSAIRKVKHVIVDEENSELLKVSYIGPSRAARIRLLADEFVYE